MTTLPVPTVDALAPCAPVPPVDPDRPAVPLARLLDALLDAPPLPAAAGPAPSGARPAGAEPLLRWDGRRRCWRPLPPR